MQRESSGKSPPPRLALLLASDLALLLLRMAALQSGAGQELLERSGRRRDDISSIVLVEKDQSYVKSQAVLKIAERLSVPFPLLAQFFLPLPLLIRDGVYDQVAANRYFFFGKSDQCRLSDDRFQDRFVD